MDDDPNDPIIQAAEAAIILSPMHQKPESLGE